MDDNDKPSDRPETPSYDDCCGNSCSPCVFDVHKKLLEQWEKNKMKKFKRKNCNNLLIPMLYKTFEVIEVSKINDDYITIIIRYKATVNNDNNNYCILLNPGQHVIINFLTWSRPFTPITWSNNIIELLIKIYPRGVFTNELKKLRISDEIRVRGPFGEFQYLRNQFKQIVMFCIGSGIAAFYPIIKCIVDDEQEETCIQLIAGFRSVNQMPLKKRLQLLTDYWNIECIIYITETEEAININNIEVKQGRINENTCKSILEKQSPESTLVLICGTEEFNESIEKWTKQCNFLNYYVFR